MSLDSNPDIQSEDNKKRSPPKLLILQKYKKEWAEKTSKRKECDSTSCENKCTKPLSLNEVKIVQASLPREVLEYERKVQLTKKTIIQENLFQLMCNSAKQKTSRKADNEVSEVNKSLRYTTPYRSRTNGYGKQSSKLDSKKENNEPKIANQNTENKFNQPNNLNQSIATHSMEQQRLEEISNVTKKFFDDFSNNQNCKLENTLHENLLKITVCESQNMCMDNIELASKKLDDAERIDNNIFKNSFPITAETNVLSSKSKITTAENISNIEYKSVLHLEQPLVDKQNEVVYNSCKRVEPMSHSTLDARFKTSNVKPQKSITEIAATKNEVNEEFFNFVNNTTTNDCIFCSFGNVTENTGMDSPLLKIKRKINMKVDEKLQVPAQFKEKFTSGLKSTPNYVMDLINQSTKQSSSINNENTIENKEDSISNQLQEKSKDFHFENEFKDILTSAQKEHINTVTSVKKKAIVDYDDDMFKFEQPIQNMNQPIEEQVYRMRSFEAPEYLPKLKQLHKSESNSSVDSDDLSLDCTSEIDDLSALRGSILSNYEAVTNKINSVTDNSNQLKQDTDIEHQTSTKGEKRICIKEANLDIPNNIKQILLEKMKSNSDDSGLGLKTSNSTKSDSSDFPKPEDYSEETCIIYHKHSNVSSNVLIQEIDSTFEKETSNEESVTKAETSKIDDKFDMFDDKEICSDDEFDIVNVAQFQPCQALISKLKGVAAAQKAIATGTINEEEAKAIISLEESNDASTESVKYVSGKSANLNVNKDEATAAKNYISEKVKADNNEDSGCPISDCDNMPKMCNPTTTVESKRVQRMKSIMQKFKKAKKNKDTREENVTEKVQQREQYQRSIDVQKDQSLRTGLILSRHQILNEVLKRNLHLHCKPMLIPSMK